MGLPSTPAELLLEPGRGVVRLFIGPIYFFAQQREEGGVTLQGVHRGFLSSSRLSFLEGETTYGSSSIPPQN